MFVVEKDSAPLAAAPLPNLKARIQIRGLAFCKLANPDSQISFLAHVPHHQIRMKIIKKIEDLTPYPEENLILLPGDDITITVDDPESMNGHIRADDGEYPLADMINLNKIHDPGGSAVIVRSTAPPTGPRKPTVVTLKECGFYTADIHPRRFFVAEIGETPPARSRHIGYVLGGLLRQRPGSTTRGDIIITSVGDSIPDKRMVLEGGNSANPSNPPTVPYYYDIIIENHCPSEEDEKECIQQVTVNGKQGTDFFFYYSVLQETAKPHRSFELILDNTGLPEDDGGGDTVAACNPVISDPANPPY